jgi:outer membrane protein assembly factor BamB
MESLGGRVPNWGYTESVLIDGNKLLCTPGGRKGAIAALDKRTGEVIWQSEELEDFAHYSSIVRGEFHGQPQYVQLLEKRLVGLATEDGGLLWEVAWPGNVAVIPTPIVHDNHVFATSGYGAGCMLVSISPQNEATKVYENKLMKNQHGGVIRVGDFAYGFSDDVGWLCLDFRTGERHWRERDALGKGAIGYADGKFYCIDQSEGQVVLIDASPEGWTERGRFTLSPQSEIRAPRGGIWVHPVIVGGKLLLRDQEFVYCYDVTQ